MLFKSIIYFSTNIIALKITNIDTQNNFISKPNEKKK